MVPFGGCVDVLVTCPDFYSPFHVFSSEVVFCPDAGLSSTVHATRTIFGTLLLTTNSIFESEVLLFGAGPRYRVPTLWFSCRN